jgi:hypothetical protein
MPRSDPHVILSSSLIQNVCRHNLKKKEIAIEGKLGDSPVAKH